MRGNLAIGVESSAEDALGSRPGPTAACRRGGRPPEDILVFRDPPCLPEPGAIDRLVAAVAAAGGMAIVTPAVRHPARRPWGPGPSRHGVRLDLERFARRPIGLDRMWRPGPGGPYESPALDGPFALTRSLYEELGGLDPGLFGPAGLAGVDLGLRAWLTGHAILHDPGAVFRASPRRSRGSPRATTGRLAGRMRLARKLFTEATWDEWLARGRGRHPREAWEAAWKRFQAGRRSVEAARARFLDRQRHDERWYAGRYGLPWPGAIPW